MLDGVTIQNNVYQTNCVLCLDGKCFFESFVFQLCYQKVLLPKMSSVGKTVKITCGVMDPEGQVIPNSFKNFDWSFDSVRDGEFTSCVSLIEQIQSLFPELASTQVSEIIFLGNYIKVLMSSILINLR